MSYDRFGVRDKVVIVTGGLGQLGRQFTQALINEGAKVAVFDIRVHKKKKGTSDWQDDRYLRFFQVDITQKTSIKRALNHVNQVWGIPHALINNAALDSPPTAPPEENGPFESYPERSWNKILDVNLKGVFLSCQIVGEQMAQAKRGSIINIGSIYGIVSPDQRLYRDRQKNGTAFFKPIAYSVSKSGLLNLTRYLATYWAKRNVRVNTLTLGGVFNHQDAKFLKRYSEKVPLGRMARADEYNGAIVFLISEASSYMTGANLVIDGGWTTW